MSTQQTVLIDKVAVPLVFVLGLLSATITGTLAYSSLDKRIDLMETRQEIYIVNMQKSIDELKAGLEELKEAQKETNERLFQEGFKLKNRN